MSARPRARRWGAVLWRATLVGLLSGCATTGLDELDDDPEVEEGGDSVQRPDEEAQHDAGARRFDAAVRRPRRRDASTDARVLLDAKLDPGAGDDAGGLRCAPGVEFPVQAARLLPREGYDYIAVREAVETASLPDAGLEDWTSRAFRTWSEAGTPCARAVGPSCAEKLAHHPAKLANRQCAGACSEHAVVTTRGDEVRRWATPADLVTLLSPIDSPDEALMLVAAEGYWLSCDAPMHSSIRERPDGYEVAAIRSLSVCPARAELVRLHVSRAGAVSLRATVALPPSGEPCVEAF